MPARKKIHRAVVEKTLPTRAERFSQTFLREIKRNFSDALFITRDDLLELPVFTHVGNQSRYKLICEMVNYLLVSRELVAKTKTILCLKAKTNSYEDTPLRVQYYDTIKSIVLSIGRKPFTVMNVVENWETDAYVTTNNKRVAVRQSMHRLITEGAIKSHDDFRYVLKGR